MNPVAVIGAGISGLTAAVQLHRQGLPVVLFEAGKSPSGMAASFADADGFSYDFGAHFVTNRLAAALGAGRYCKTVRYYGESVFTRRTMYSYPFGLIASPRFVYGAAVASLKQPEIRSAADWFQHAYGKSLAQEIAIPLTEAWSGARAEDLSPAVGNKLGSSVLQTLYLRAAARLTNRAVCNGYSHEMPEGPNVFHVYPDGGVARLLDPLTKELGSIVQTESPVTKIWVENDAAVAIQVNGRELPVSAVISSAPLHTLSKLVSGTAALDHLREFQYRPMIFVNLRFQGRELLPDTVVWVPDRTLPFFRLTEASRSMPWLAPQKKTMISFDIGCQVGDRYWTMSDEELTGVCLDGLSRIIPNSREKYLGGCRVLKTPIAYPVYLLRYEQARLRFANSTGVKGLYSTGRNGEFAHLLMEDVYWRTRKKAAEVAAYVTNIRNEKVGMGEDHHLRLAAST